jgi:hypothetical protein
MITRNVRWAIVISNSQGATSPENAFAATCREYSVGISTNAIFRAMMVLIFERSNLSVWSRRRQGR